MTLEKLTDVLSGLRNRHFRSMVFTCDVAAKRDELAKTLTKIVKEDGLGRIVNLAEITRGLERYEDFQLEVWRRTVVSAREIDGYLLILDAEDALAKWSADTRQLAWSFLSKICWCRGVLVVSTIEPTRNDDFRRLGYLHGYGDFVKIPYFQSDRDDAEECWRLEVVAMAS